MVEYYVVFSSITHAMKVEKHTKHPGKRCTIVRTPAELGLGGCGYSIKTDSEEFARMILSATEGLDVRTLGLYIVKDRVEVVQLS